MLTTADQMIERPAFGRGVTQWCSTTPCCGAEVRLTDGEHTYAHYVARAWRSPDEEPDPENRWAWFWFDRTCYHCGKAWRVAFGDVDADGDPGRAFWR